MQRSGVYFVELKHWSNYCELTNNVLKRWSTVLKQWPVWPGRYIYSCVVTFTS